MNLTEAFDSVVDKLGGWVRGAIESLPNLVAAILVITLFWILARAGRNLLRRVLGRVSQNRQIVGLLSTMLYVVVLLVGLFIALGILGLDKTVTSLLAGVGIVGLALGFAFQDLAANFMAGVLMAIRRPFKMGEIVESNGYTGVVEAVSLRSTDLRTFQGQQVMIPNKDVFGSPIVNYSAKGKRRVDIACGVAYGDDLREAERLAVEAIDALEGRDRERGVELFYTGFGDSSIDFTLRFWIDFDKQTDFLAAQSEAIKALKGAFDDGGITIPFPIRTLDFGVVGGEPLREALPEAWLRGAPSAPGAERSRADGDAG